MFYGLELFAERGGWRFYKIEVEGAITKEIIAQTCEEANLVPTCAGPGRCSTSSCTVTSLNNCDFPMREFSQAMCGEDNQSKCSNLIDVFIYYAKNPNFPSGALSVQQVPSPGMIDGTIHSGANKFALCATNGTL